MNEFKSQLINVLPVAENVVAVLQFAEKGSGMFVAALVVATSWSWRWHRSSFVVEHFAAVLILGQSGDVVG